MPFTLDRDSLIPFGDLAIDAVVAISRLVSTANSEAAPDMVTAIHAVTRVFSLVIRKRITQERGLELIQQIGMRFVNRTSPTG